MENRDVQSYGLMSLETLDAVLKKAFEYAEGFCHVGFQGGEPTLVGLDFFRQYVKLKDKYKRPGLNVTSSIQTNGMLFDSEWAAFLAENDFLTGLSIDGPKEIHDSYRLDGRGKGTFQRVLRAANLLRSSGAEFNILTVVTSRTAHRAASIYGFFQRNGFTYQQYIPCLDPLETKRGELAYSLTPPQYAKFLRELFQQWQRDILSGKLVSVRYFDNILQLLVGQPPESCGRMGRCTNQWIVEADGSVFPCDFFALDEWKLGNIVTDPVEEIAQNPLIQSFIDRSLIIHDDCKQCQWWALCRGGCYRDRQPPSSGEIPKDYFCEAYKDFFSFAVPKMQEIISKLRLG